MALSDRLKKIVEYAGKCAVVSDIGTDHALIPVYLVENALCSRAYASDVRSAPLKRAEDYIAARGLEDRITVLLSDGLDKIPTDTDTIVIAGMGGELIRDILKRDRDHSDALFVLQPMSSVPELRMFLYDNGYEILDEDIVSEHADKKLYSVMKVIKNGISYDYSLIDTLISPVLRTKKTVEKRLYIEKMINVRKKILNRIVLATEPDNDQISKISQELSDLEGCL